MTKVGVLGPGAVGGLLAALLGRAGHDVTVIASESTSAVLARDGLTVHSEHRFGTVRLETVHSVGELSDPVDLLFIAVKATALETALERVPAPVVTPSTLVVPLLNGVEHVETLRSRYPDAPIAPAAVQVVGTRVAPGVIEHHSPFAKVALANGDSAELAAQCAAVLLDAGLDVDRSESEIDVLWHKLAFLAPLALTTTRHEATAGVVRTEHRADVVALIEEVVTVAVHEGATLRADDLVSLFDSVPEGTRSSMQKDAEAGHRTELEAIGGALLRRAARHGVPVPVATRYVDELRSRVTA